MYPKTEVSVQLHAPTDLPARESSIVPTGWSSVLSGREVSVP
jgi:hypothetical protein